MTKPLHQPKKIVSISEAAQILGVSVDTVRRWDKTGLLKSERPDGKNRYFSLNQLKSFKLNQPLSISEASYELHISPTTLRRLVKKGLIQSGRNTAGERVFPKDALKDFLNSDYYLRRRTSDGPKEKTVKKNFNPN
jgi:excisionase family DNA binding protein